MSVNAVADVANPQLGPPSAADESGRSEQTFLVEVVARAGKAERRAVARGRDIYAVSASLVVEALERVLAPVFTRSGALSAGEAVDARKLLAALAPEHITLELDG